MSLQACVSTRENPQDKGRESIEVRESERVVLGDIHQKGGHAALSWLLSFAVLVLCVISPLQLPSLNADPYRLPKRLLSQVNLGRPPSLGISTFGNKSSLGSSSANSSLFVVRPPLPLLMLLQLLLLLLSLLLLLLLLLLLGRGDAMVGNLHRPQSYQFELFELKFLNSSCASLSSYWT